MIRSSVLACALGALMALGYAAYSHDELQANTYGHSQWRGNHHPPGLDVHWRFNSDFPTGAKRDRMVEAFEKWNDQGQNLQFVKFPEDPTHYSFLCSDYQEYNGVFFENVPNQPHGAGWGRACSHEGPDPESIHNVFIVMDPDNSWYSGTQKSEIGVGQLDFKGIATHEVGHITGFFGHFGGSYCDGSPSTSQTMCTGAGFGVVGPGTYEARTLEEHDKHTFDAAYVNQ
jgi:hypothetical protein